MTAVDPASDLPDVTDPRDPALFDIAAAEDRADALAPWRDRFELPRSRRDGAPLVYLCGHSLGALPRATRGAVGAVLDTWSRYAVDGHFEADDRWYGFEAAAEADLAQVVGARTDEVAVAGTLTANMHQLLASFYRPSGTRRRILVESTAFPSDRYAVDTHVTWHGLDPAAVVVEAAPGPDGCLLGPLLAAIDQHGDELAVVCVGGVNYYSGEVLDLAALTEAAHRVGAVVVADLAHAAGNVELALHDWGVDAAAWCTYKYLNSGPGSVGAWFVHERHGSDARILRLAGWWGNDPERRFAMDTERAFVARPGASGWKQSNPPILSVAAVATSAAMFAEATMPALRAKSRRLTGWLHALLERVDGVHVITPASPPARGAMVSVRLPADAAGVQAALHDAGVVVDQRPPDVIRIAAAPIYNSWTDVAAAVRALDAVLAGR